MNDVSRAVRQDPAVVVDGLRSQAWADVQEALTGTLAYRRARDLLAELQPLIDEARSELEQAEKDQAKAERALEKLQKQHAELLVRAQREDVYDELSQVFPGLSPALDAASSAKTRVRDVASELGRLENLAAALERVELPDLGELSQLWN